MKNDAVLWILAGVVAWNYLQTKKAADAAAVVALPGGAVVTLPAGVIGPGTNN